MAVGLTVVLAATLAGCATTQERAASPGVRLALPTLEGGHGRLSDYRGQVVVLNFFATWCLPCVAEVPLFNRLAREYGPRGLTVIGVSMDEAGREAVSLFVQRFGVEYPVWLADDRVFRGESDFGPIVAIPATFVVDRQGRVVGAQMGLLQPKAFEAFLDRVLSGRIAPPPE